MNQQVEEALMSLPRVAAPEPKRALRRQYKRLDKAKAGVYRHKWHACPKSSDLNELHEDFYSSAAWINKEKSLAEYKKQAWDRMHKHNGDWTNWHCAYVKSHRVKPVPAVSEQLVDLDYVEFEIHAFEDVELFHVDENFDQYVPESACYEGFVDIVTGEAIGL